MEDQADQGDIPSPVIRASFLWAPDEVSKGFGWHQKHGSRRYLRYALWVLVAFFLATGLWLALHGDQTGLKMIFFSVVLISISLLGPWSFRRQIRKRPECNTKVELEISSEGVQTHTHTIDSKVTWSGLVQVVQTPEGFLFYPNQQMFNWIPKKGFKSEQEFQRAAKMAKEYAAKFIEIT